jgi:hypothetical protein
MSESPLPEPLDDFLLHPPVLPMDLQRKEELFQQTAPALGKRRGHWPVLPIAVAAGVLFGVLLSYLLFPRAAPGPEATKQEQAQHPGNARQEPTPAPTPAVRVQVQPRPRDLEWKAFDASDDKERVRLYFRAGNLYLEMNEDFESALRCYSQALTYCDARELELKPDDNWLVMALKTDRRKEP